MKLFEILLSDTQIENTQVYEYQEPVWRIIFDTEDLSTLFDMTPAVEAIQVIDAAVSRLMARSEEIRQVISADEKLGVRGYRSRLLAMRRDLVNYPAARMSGVIEADE
ncbi:hypothetical protein IU451_29315 [Nocardia cyriacigeorgica]|uniref:hypothetical protein n=1 Tax=Nocardia cyriacigeorgica TaxID=135487 RepID=UPI001894047B|nr:hypothetical protein [Nocardia cyriacigeorgica]MBF6326601.1 hypothetical protein [Nocardia cyriacigeorgica]